MIRRLAAAILLLAACGGGGASTPSPDGAPATPDAAAPPPDAAPAALPCKSVLVGPGLPAALIDGGATRSTLVVGPIGNGRVRRVTVSVDLRHGYPRELTLTLVAPDGTPVVLSAGRGQSDGYLGTVFDDAAPIAIDAGEGSFTGSFRPEQPLAALVGGEASGIWTLQIDDAALGDGGTLEAWSLHLSACAAPACSVSTVAIPGLRAEAHTPGQGLATFTARVDPTAIVVDARPRVSVRYPFDEQLALTLWSPSGSAVLLSRGNGGLGSDYLATLFDDRAVSSIRQGQAPFTGTFRPEERLARLAGESAAGAWLFTVSGGGADDNLEVEADLALALDLCELPCPEGTGARRQAADPDAGAGMRRISIAGAEVVRALGVRVSLPAGPLRLTLRSPGGQTVTLLDGETVLALDDALFADGAERTPAATPGSASLLGSFRPTQPLAALAGAPAAGDWIVAAATGAGQPVPIPAAALELCVGP